MDNNITMGNTMNLMNDNSIYFLPKGWPKSDAKFSKSNFCPV